MSIEIRWNYAKRGKSKYSEKSLSQSQFHPNYSGIELVPPRQEDGEYLPESSYFVVTDWSGSRSKRLNPDGTYMLQCD
jgi:hypothetical protein